MPADDQAWKAGTDIAAEKKKNLDDTAAAAGKTAGKAASVLGMLKHGGKIKKTGRYKLHKGEEERRGAHVVRKIKKTGIYRAQKDDRVVTAKTVKKQARDKRVARKKT